ncbi:hypothetical protein GCM10019059_23980 [Camelimonas fluminis]|nr:hypothetical protein GCM10019059_23980 [Camelimonas fluminis]
MSYDGLFQLGMGAVLLKASQTEDTIGSGAMTRRARALFHEAQSGMPTRGSRKRGACAATHAHMSTASGSRPAPSMRERAYAGAAAWIVSRLAARTGRN